jgi:hypothetical protein
MNEFKGPFSWPLVERSFWALVALMLLLLAARQTVSVLQESATIDEGAHLAAGYSYWKTHDFRLLPSHPPLAELFCALPLLVLKPDFTPSPEAWRDADEYAVGKQFLYQNRIPADTLLFAGRSMTILLTVILGLTLAWWTRKRFGAPAALISLLIFTFSPLIIAHGRYVTTDLAVTAFIFWSCLMWLSYLETGERSQLLWTGVLAGLAFGSKFNGLILYAIFPLLYWLHRWKTPLAERRKESPREWFVSLVLVPFLIIYSLFFFDTRSVLKDPRLGPRLQNISEPARTLAAIPIPAYYYARGLHILLRDMKGGHPAYLMGRPIPRGSWLYFPVAFAVKTPLADLLLLALCALLAARKWRQNRAISFVWLALAAPPLLYFAVSMTSSMNIGVRHLLPVYPFIFVLTGAVLFGRAHGRYTIPACAAGFALAALMIAESASIHPDYLAFFNVLSGGPRNGPHYLIDSNLDWGQDLKKLKRWADVHRAAPLCLSYFGPADPSYYRIAYQPLTSARNRAEVEKLDCFAAVSSHELFGTEAERFGALREMEPVARVGYSIYVYDLRKKTAAPQRRGRAIVRTQGAFLRW